jgi:predicted  nucleic acid-binding Zn-ribbon protein
MEVAEEDFKKAIMTTLESIVTEMTKMKTKMEDIESKIGKTEEKMEKFSKAPGAERIKTNSSLRTIGQTESTAADKKLEILKELRKSFK